jgi:hypothetical protein
LGSRNVSILPIPPPVPDNPPAAPPVAENTPTDNTTENTTTAPNQNTQAANMPTTSNQNTQAANTPTTPNQNTAAAENDLPTLHTPSPPARSPSTTSSEEDSEIGSPRRTRMTIPPTNSRTPAQVAHGTAWYVDNSAITGTDLNGPIPSRKWYVEDQFGDRLSASSLEKGKCMSRLCFFLLMFPPDHLLKIVALTNNQLQQKRNQADTTRGEILKFFGVIILGTRFEFNSRRDLWSTHCKSKLRDPPKFGEKTGMSRYRFDSLWSAIHFSDQPDTRPGGMSLEQYRWKLVDDFVEAFNNYRAAK